MYSTSSNLHLLDFLGFVFFWPLPWENPTSRSPGNMFFSPVQRCQCWHLMRQALFLRWAAVSLGDFLQKKGKRSKLNLATQKLPISFRPHFSFILPSSAVYFLLMPPALSFRGKISICTFPMTNFSPPNLLAGTALHTLDWNHSGLSLCPFELETKGGRRWCLRCQQQLGSNWQTDLTLHGFLKQNTQLSWLIFSRCKKI